MKHMVAMVLENVMIQEAEKILEKVHTDDPVSLIVWNDNINTFDWVIRSLVEICGHTAEQAEQCAWLIHHKGKYAVKQGTHKKLSLMREGLTDRGIGATIEEMASS